MNRKEIIARLTEIMSGMSEDRLLILLKQLETRPLKWNRQHPRKTCQISVDYDTLDYSSNKTIKNLSTSGAFIEAGESFAIGQEILLWFSVAGDKSLSINIPARVIRRGQNGIGVKFEQLSREQLDMLRLYEKLDED
jgi:hypothetical protein